MSNWLYAKKAGILLSISRSSIKKLEKEGKIQSRKLPNGYTQYDIESYKNSFNYTKKTIEKDVSQDELLDIISVAVDKLRSKKPIEENDDGAFYGLLNHEDDLAYIIEDNKNIFENVDKMKVLSEAITALFSVKLTEKQLNNIEMKINKVKNKGS